MKALLFEFNRGITRVQEMLKENGNPPAEFDVNTITAFRVYVKAVADSDQEGTSQGTSQKAANQNVGQKATSRPTSQGNKIIENKIVQFCVKPRTLAEIALHCGFKNKRKFKERYLVPLIGTRISMTIPDKPTSRFQKYVVIGA